MAKRKKNPHAVALGRLGGQASDQRPGGRARQAKMTRAERSALGRKAAAARWRKK
jgi:hypothetical protein